MEGRAVTRKGRAQTKGARCETTLREDGVQAKEARNGRLGASKGSKEWNEW